jgi:hypothetical protein
MTRGIKSVAFGAVVVAAAFAVPAVAKADRFDRDRHDWRDHDRGGRVNVDIRTGGDNCERPPVIVDRPQQVWVEPVYRTVCDRVWVAPVFQTVCEKVWREPVVEKRTERVWVPASRVVQDVRRGNHVSREWVFTPAHYEDHCQEVVVSPGHWEDVQKQVLVAEGHWQNVERQELVSAGHWETRVERVAVAAPEPRHDGVRIDLKLPVHW